MSTTTVFISEVERVIAGFTPADAPLARAMLAELDGIAKQWPRMAVRCAVYEGRLHTLLAEPEAALAAYDRALALQPRDPSQVFLRRGDLHRDCGRYHEALADYAAALNSNPDAGEILLHRAEAHRLAGNRDAARADLEQALANDPRRPLLRQKLDSLER